MGLEDLSEAECLSLIEKHAVGRLAIVHEGQPLIFPINFVLHDKTVVFRVEEGSTIANATMTPVAFEIDAVNEASQQGWSVMIHGRARDITTTIDEHSEDLRRLEVSPWAPGPKACWMAIEVRSVTGRRLS